MTLEQKLGAVFCARRFGEEDIAFTLEMIQKRALGCVQLPAANPALCEKIRRAADYPVLIFNDTEMGFPTSSAPKIPPIALGACDNGDYYRVFAKRTVCDAKAAGFNGTWGPILDLLRVDGPCRVHRSFSDDPKKAAKAAEAIAEVYRQNRYLSTGKHYPGGHDAPYDTHMREGISTVSEEELIKTDLAPYLELAEKGLLPCIMTGHTVYPAVDPEYPASLSKKVIDLIRDRGYDGLIFTDSFAMMGILQKYGEENVYGMALAAGNDIVLPNFRHSSRECFQMLVQNYKDGLFSEQRLNEAVRRVLAAQDFISEAPDAPLVFTEEDRATFDRIAKDCLTAVTDGGADIALPSAESDERLFVILTENGFDTAEESQEVTVAPWYRPQQIAEAIRQKFPCARIEFLPEFPAQRDAERVLAAAGAFRHVTFVTFCNTAPYLGTDSLTKRVESIIGCLSHSGKVEAVVHFGNPFALQTLPHVPRRLFGYMIPESQPYAIAALKGEIKPKGKLPFRVELP